MKILFVSRLLLLLLFHEVSLFTFHGSNIFLFFSFTFCTLCDFVWANHFTFFSICFSPGRSKTIQLAEVKQVALVTFYLSVWPEGLHLCVFLSPSKRKTIKLREVETQYFAGDFCVCAPSLALHRGTANFFLVGGCPFGGALFGVRKHAKVSEEWEEIEERSTGPFRYSSCSSLTFKAPRDMNVGTHPLNLKRGHPRVGMPGLTKCRPMSNALSSFASLRNSVTQTEVGMRAKVARELLKPREQRSSYL